MGLAQSTVYYYYVYVLLLYDIYKANIIISIFGGRQTFMYNSSSKQTFSENELAFECVSYCVKIGLHSLRFQNQKFTNNFN